ncbi:DNA-binding response regulator [uncultured Tenacibaculum sp.]|uniref:DNA-binding response regulator n=1 Tax=uncultured Tenacibaculum sp. TaxID=174713 RepID=UPI002627C6CC|nr:DNA-binding response regulator [uncultured Tenacibaculum sp.]
MKKEKNTALVVDSCPLICEKYKDILNLARRESKNEVYNIDIAYNNEGAFDIVKRVIETERYLEFILLELKLPPTKDKKILSGLDFGVLVRKLLPTTKIIVITSCNDNYLIHGVFKHLNPEGFLIKSDLTSETLISAVKSVNNETPYYSQTVLKLLRKEISNDFQLDSMDRKILYELSIGSRMKDLPNYIPLSVASIEKRKRQLRKVFGVKEKGDRELILKAREKGFI